MNAKIHLIFSPTDNENNSLVEPFKEYGVLVDYDEDFYRAIKRLEDPDNKSPNVILASELAAQGYKNKYETLGKQLEVIRELADSAKVILLLNSEPEGKFKELMAKSNINLVLGQEYELDIEELIKVKEEQKEIVQKGSHAIQEEELKGNSTDLKFDPFSLSKASASAKQNKNNRSHQPQNNIKKVLKADGHPEYIEIIKAMSGIELVDEVKTRETFFERLAVTTPDIVILSPDLPGEEDLLELVDSVDKDTRIIVINAKKIIELDREIMRNFGVEMLEEESIGALESLIKRNTQREVPKLEVSILPPGEENRGERKKTTDPLGINALNIRKAAENMGKALQGTGDVVASAKEKMSSIKIKIGTKPRIIPNLICVAGVKAVGKTIIAANLSWKLADAGNITNLIDCSPDQDIHTWLKMPFEENGLYTALTSQEEPENLVWSPKLNKNLWVLSSDLEVCSFIFSHKEMAKLAETMAQTADFVVVDLPSKLDSNQAKVLLQMASVIIIVADLDIAHTVKLQRVINDMLKDLTEENRLILVANNYDPSETKEINSIRAAVNLKEEFIVPAKAIEVRKSIRKGVPLCMFDAEFGLVFAEMADYIEAITRRLK